MRFLRSRWALSVGGLLIFLNFGTFPSTYNGRPKPAAGIVIDQFGGDYPDGYRARVSDGGFRLFLDGGADFGGKP